MKHSYRSYGSKKGDLTKFKTCGYLRDVLIHQNQGKVKGHCSLNGLQCDRQISVSSDCVDVYQVFEQKWIQEKNTAEERKKKEHLERPIEVPGRGEIVPSEIEIKVETEDVVFTSA